VKTLPPPATDEDFQEEGKEPVYRRWSREDVAELHKTQPVTSPWRVVLWMLLATAAIGVIGLIASDARTAMSAAYGSLAVAIPAAVLARGMTSPLSSLSATSGAMAFMVWEMVKIGLSIGMLVLAPSLVADLSWPALLAGLIVTMKVYFVAAIVKPKALGPV
jgi:ATP synthase protein I